MRTTKSVTSKSVQRFSRAGPRGREWATLGVHSLSWLLSNNRLEDVCGTLTTGTFSSRLLLSNQDKGCTPSVAHSLPLPLGPALLNLSIVYNCGWFWDKDVYQRCYNFLSNRGRIIFFRMGEGVIEKLGVTDFFMFFFFFFNRGSQNNQEIIVMLQILLKILLNSLMK